MRKDVRMGFAVGGVLLAVIIVAVLVFHRNHGAKQVAFDPGKSQADSLSAGPGQADVSAPSQDARSPEQAVVPPAADQPKPDDAKAADPAPPTPKTNDKWDALFASTGDPIKAQLTTSRAKPSRHGASEPIVAPREESRAGANETIANAPLDVGSSGESSSPVRQSDEGVSASPRTTSERGRAHRVELGETMVSIARAAYGDGRYYKAIVNANPSVNPSRLKPGTMLELPPASQVKQSSRQRSARAAGDREPAARDANTYVVQKGDSLYSISHKLYRSDRHEEIYNLNVQVIGPDSTKLKPGMVLKLPTTATASR